MCVSDFNEIQGIRNFRGFCDAKMFPPPKWPVLCRVGH